MRKPIIGLTANSAPEAGKIDIRGNYLLSVTLAGGIPVMLPHTEGIGYIDRVIGDIDGVIFTGGGDFDPALYGEEKLPQCHEPDGARDVFELELFGRARNTGIPVLGICRGCQLINVAMGGSLIQDIPAFGIENIDHYQTTDGAEPFHSVAVERDSLLYSIIGKESLQVNSFHHQAVKVPGRGLIVSASAPDGITEAVEAADGSFILGVQWHPEHMTSFRDDMLKIFTALIAAAKK